MAEKIEREAAIDALDEFRLNQTVSKYATVMQCRAARDAISRAIKVLESLPAADVEPVKHGQWIAQTDYPGAYAKCSECGCRCRGYVPNYKYCPNCGAKMDEEGTHER